MLLRSVPVTDLWPGDTILDKDGKPCGVVDEVIDDGEETVWLSDSESEGAIRRTARFNIERFTED